MLKNFNAMFQRGQGKDFVFGAKAEKFWVVCSFGPLAFPKPCEFAFEIMNIEQEKQKMREVIDTWLKASAAGDLERVLPLMAEEETFFLFSAKNPTDAGCCSGMQTC